MAQWLTSPRCYCQSTVAHLNFPRERRIAAATAEMHVASRSHVAAGRTETLPAPSPELLQSWLWKSSREI